MLPNGERKERNSKLENFLRRKLTPSVYGDVRWYEPVVVRKAETLSYKQAVVTGEEIILVDTHPKEIHPLLVISNITAVLMVHDLPEFLEGGLRDRTTHVLLKVKQDSSAKNVPEKNRSGSFSRGVTSQRRGSLQHVISEEENQESKVASPKDKDSEVPEISTKKTKWKRFLERQSSRDILSFSSLDLGKVPHLSKQDLTKSLTINNASKSGLRPPLLRGVTVTDESDVKVKRLAPAESVPSLSFGENIPEGGGSGGLSPLYGVKGEFGTRPISPALFDVLNRIESKSLTPNGRSLTPDFSRHQAIPRSISAFETYDNSSAAPSLRSRSVLDKPLNLQSETIPRRRHSTNNLNTTEGVEEEEVHLYTLSTSTHLFHLLHSLWMAYLLTPKNETPDLNVSMQLNEEGIDQTFRSLCNDLQEANSMEEHYSLLQDLLQGLKKYSTVRRVFWRQDSEALNLILKLLRTYCRSSSRSRGNKTENATNFGRRENELKIVVLILQIIQMSLDHSQGCPHKAKTLNNKGLLEELLKDVFMIPEVPPPHNLMCKRFLCDYRELAEGAWQLLPEKELLILVQKSINASVAASFQVIEAIFEIGWTGGQMGKSKARKKESNTLSVLLQFVPIDEWLCYTMPKLLLLVQPKVKDDEESLHEDDLILLYKYLAVLMALLKQSPKALAFCISNYAEELRYYVNESVLKRRLDTLNPLTPHTFRLAKSISKLIIR
ncbi:UNVERIFIED_CONTAM: hypothetical protein RMT77_011885 [Armadillidium vulgare]